MITEIKLYQVYKFLRTVEEDKVPWCTLKAYWEKQCFSWIIPTQAKANSSMGLLLLTNLGALGG